MISLGAFQGFPHSLVLLALARDLPPRVQELSLVFNWTYSAVDRVEEALAQINWTAIVRGLAQHPLKLTIRLEAYSVLNRLPSLSWSQESKDAVTRAFVSQLGETGGMVISLLKL